MSYRRRFLIAGGSEKLPPVGTIYYWTSDKQPATLYTQNKVVSNTYTNKGILITTETTTLQTWFRNCTNVTKVLIWDGITIIYDNAFADCINLEYINIPYSVQKIYQAAFENTKLKTIDISNIKELRVYAFINSSLINVKNNIFSESEKIGAYAFKNCSNLIGNVILSSLTTTIDSEAFYGTKIEELINEGDITYFGRLCFSEVTTLNKVFDDLFLNNPEIKYRAFFNTSIGFNKTLKITTTKKFEEGSFAKTLYKKLDLSECGDVQIEASFGGGKNGSWGTFDSMPNLEEVTLPNTDAASGQFGFVGSKLKKVIAGGNNTKITKLFKKAFKDCEELTEIPSLNYLTEFHREALVNTPNLHIQLNCPNLTGVFGDVDTAHNSGITDIIDLGSIMQIGSNTLYNGSNSHYGAFEKCHSLVNVTLPSTITELKPGTFMDCENLEFVDFSNCSDLELKDAVFNNCSKLDLNNCDGLNKIKIISGYNTFKNTKCTIVSLPNLERIEDINISINACAFRDVDYTQLNFPKLKYVGTKAFYKSKGLPEINFPSVETIKTGAFSCDEHTSDYIYEFKKFIFGQNLSSIENKAINYPGYAIFSENIIIEILATTPPTLASDTPFNCGNGSYNQNYKVYVPDVALNDYKTAEHWSTFADRIYPISELPTT